MMRTIIKMAKQWRAGGGELFSEDKVERLELLFGNKAAGDDGLVWVMTTSWKPASASRTSARGTPGRMRI